MRSRRMAFVARHGLVLLLILSFALPAFPVAAQEGSAAAAPAPKAISLANNKFDPDVMMVVVNTTVTWTHRDSAQHDVTGIGNNISSPRAMTSGATYEFKFEKAGVYDYYCTVHSKGRGDHMWGRVVVVDEPILALGGAAVAPEKLGVHWLAHWVGIISFIAVFVILIIYYFVLKFGETVHATDHRDRKEK